MHILSMYIYVLFTPSEMLSLCSYILNTQSIMLSMCIYIFYTQSVCEVCVLRYSVHSLCLGIEFQWGQNFLCPLKPALRPIQPCVCPGCKVVLITHSLLAQRLRMDWDCTSASPLCLHRCHGITFTYTQSLCLSMYSQVFCAQYIMYCSFL